MSEENNLTFRGQRDGEKVIFVTNQHPWVLAKAGFIILILILVMIGAIAIFGASGISSWVILVLFLFIFCYGFYNWYLWKNGMYILTNLRIIKSMQISLFHRAITEAELHRIQDITCEVNGFSNTALNIGDIKVQTASDKLIDFKNIYNPYDLQQKIVATSGKKIIR